MIQDSALAQAESLLLAPFSLSEGDLSRTFGQILTHQVDYADLYFQYSRSEAWSLDEGIVKSGSFNIDQGLAYARCPARKPPLPTPTTSVCRPWAMPPMPCEPLAPPGKIPVLANFSRRPQQGRCMCRMTRLPPAG
jgi:hypothetical protein